MKYVFFMAALLCSGLVQAQNDKKEMYRCTPCGSECDKKEHAAEGECKDCRMKLVPASTIKFTEISADSICKYIKLHPQTILLDVRSKAEYEGKADPNFGTLLGAINIPIQELPQRISELEKYRGREILVFCSHSRRSPRAAYLLMQQGFQNVVNMSGGMSVVKDSNCKK